MTEQQDWAKEPWGKNDVDGINDADGYGILDHEEHWGLWSYDERNTPRIIACVNACAGVPTEVLERLNIKECIEKAWMYNGLG